MILIFLEGISPFVSNICMSLTDKEKHDKASLSSIVGTEILFQ